MREGIVGSLKSGRGFVERSMGWRVNCGGVDWGCGGGGVWRSDCGLWERRSVVVAGEGWLLMVEITKSAICGQTRGWRVEPRITPMVCDVEVDMMS